MKSLDLNNWLRYYLTGAALIGVTFIRIISQKNCEPILTFPTLELTEKIFALISVPLIIGSLIYIINRAIFFPIIYRILLVIVLLFIKRSALSRDMIIPYVPSSFEINKDKKRWRKGDIHLSEWGAQIHFLYSFSVGLLFLIWTNKIMLMQESTYISYAFWIIFASAIIHHLRYLIFTEKE
ncbi:MAG: hypothetical protein ABJF11_15275 [Reichenbachiella sp.]|uniref:hypothetical protein n=1 Tax=Reichenbachiella sp. TaxID=2184521 RepID=UPI003265A9AE